MHRPAARLQQMEAIMRRPDSRIIHRRAELSQHFLRPRAARALVRHAALPAGALVVDAGAGDGAITAVLAEAGHRVMAVERDPLLFGRLRRRFEGDARVSARLADVRVTGMPQHPYHVVANVPYAITAEFVRRLLHAARPPDSATLIVQREAAEKFAGAPRETAFSLLHKPGFEIDILATVPRAAFVPPPRVESRVLRVVRRDAALIASASRHRYEGFVETVLGHGSGELGRALRRYLTPRQIRRLAMSAGFGARARTSQLTFEQWLVIFRFVEHECLGHDPTLTAA